MKNFILLLALFFTVQTSDGEPMNKPMKEMTEAQQLRVAEIENRFTLSVRSGPCSFLPAVIGEK